MHLKYTQVILPVPKPVKTVFTREEVIENLNSMGEHLFSTFSSEEFNEIKMRQSYGYQRGKAFSTWINGWIKNYLK